MKNKLSSHIRFNIVQQNITTGRMKVIYIVFVLLMIFVSSVGLKAQGTSSAKELSSVQKRLYDKAIDYGRMANQKRAIDILRIIAKENPDNIDVNYNLGLCYVNVSGNPDSAIYFLKRTVQLDTQPWTDDNVDLHIALNRAYQQKYDYQSALAELDLIGINNKSGYNAAVLKRERDICQNAKVLMMNPVKLEVTNLGDSINSEYDDYRPVLSSTGNEMIFTSRRYDVGKTVRFDDGQYEESAYYVRFKDGRWSAPTRIENLFVSKTKGQEAVTCIANEDRELYIYRDGAIYMSTRENVDSEWGIATKLPEPINGYGEVRYVCVSNDGQQMFFSSNSEGGFGGYDLYHSYRLPNGNWGVPVNMGPSINTDYDEDAPVLHPNSNILYFSSQGHNTMGGYDIFYTIQNPDSTYEAVKNIGYPINTPDDDIYFVPSPMADVAYYSSLRWDDNADNRTSRGYDIYKVVYDEPELDKLAVISGVVLVDPGVTPRISTKLSNEETGRYQPNSKGRFVLIVEAGYDYDLHVTCGDLDSLFVVHTAKTESFSKMGKPIDMGTINLRTNNFMLSPFAVVNDTESVPQDLNIAEGKKESVVRTEQQQGRTSCDGFTVQVLSLNKVLEAERLVGIGIDELKEEKVGDWYVYTYGIYSSYREAQDCLAQIISETPYKDAIVIRTTRYKKQE